MCATRLSTHVYSLALHRSHFESREVRFCQLLVSNFFDVAIDMVTELLMIRQRGNGCIECKAMLLLLLRMRSSDDAPSSDLLRMRDSSKLLV